MLLKSYNSTLLLNGSKLHTPCNSNKPFIFNNLYFLNELQTSYKKDGIIDFNVCRVSPLLITQTLSPKKVVTNELQTFSYKLWITLLVSTRYVFRGLIDSLNCRGKINGVGWKCLFLHMTRYDNLIKPYSVIWHH